MWSREKRLEYYRQYNLKRREKLNQYMKDRQQTPEGLLKRIYSSQLYHSRHRGHDKPAYTWKDLVDKYVNDPVYLDLYKKWIDGGKQRWDKPSLDRIDESKGYSFENIVLTTWRINFKRGHESLKKMVYFYDSNGNYLFSIKGRNIAEDKFNMNVSYYLDKNKLTKEGYMLSSLPPKDEKEAV